MESKLNRTRRAQKEMRGETGESEKTPPFPALFFPRQWNRLSDYVGSLYFNPAGTGFRWLKGKDKRQFSCLKLVDRKDLSSLKVN